MVCDIILNVQAIRLTYLFAEIELKKVFNLFQVATRFLASRYQAAALCVFCATA